MAGTQDLPVILFSACKNHLNVNALLLSISYKTALISLTRQIHSTFIVSTTINLNFFAINHTAPYKLLPSINTSDSIASFFVSFSLHTFLWVSGNLHEAWKFFQTLFCAFTYLSKTHSFLNRFQLVSALLPCMPNILQLTFSNRE